MSTIIKASDRNLAVQHVAFNFDDMNSKADEYLAQIRAEGTKLIVQAKQEADEIRRQAQEEGRRQGLAVVQQLVDKQLGDKLATLLPALKQVIADIHDAKHAWLTHWEKSAVHVAAKIAQRVIRREVAQEPEITLDLVHEALELAAGNSQLRIHLNPKDHESLSSQIELLMRELIGVGEAELIPNPEITPGGCRVETALGIIDQQFGAQLARIEEELT